MDQEMSGARTLEYSQWHRTDSLARFIGRKEASSCAQLDIDFAEFDRQGSKPLFLKELAQGTRRHKTTKVMDNLANMAGIPALLILYDLSDELNPMATIEGCRDIERFQVFLSSWPDRLAKPTKTPKPFLMLTPDQYAKFLLWFRRRCIAGVTDYPICFQEAK